MIAQPPAAGRPVFRFAPSPNGRLHLGHALSALLNAKMAARSSGRLLLRIEDIDPERSRPEFQAAILDDLRWLGLEWEEPVRRQSAHFGDYCSLLERLQGEGLAYPAFMSRGEAQAHVKEEEARGAIWPRDPDGAPHYPSSDRSLSDAERRRRIADRQPVVWRLDMAEALRRVSWPLVWREWRNEALADAETVEADPAIWGDVVLARQTVPTSYHLSVVADDALQGVSHVVRGRDLRAATAVHRLLQDLLGLPQPSYFHHRLILGSDGRKLSKSEGAAALAYLRAEGRTPADIRRMVGLDEERSG